MTSKLFMKIIASYIILCAIPLITGLVAYENAVSSAEKQTVRLTGAALQRAAAMTDNAIGEIESMTAGLAVNPNITRMVSSRPICRTFSISFLPIHPEVPCVPSGRISSPRSLSITDRRPGSRPSPFLVNRQYRTAAPRVIPKP